MIGKISALIQGTSTPVLAKAAIGIAVLLAGLLAANAVTGWLLLNAHQSMGELRSDLKKAEHDIAEAERTNQSNLDKYDALLITHNDLVEQNRLNEQRQAIAVIEQDHRLEAMRQAREQNAADREAIYELDEANREWSEAGVPVDTATRWRDRLERLK